MHSGGIGDSITLSPIKNSLYSPALFKHSTTNAIVGSFKKVDIEDNLIFIRRKFKERFGTTQELMQGIRRVKLGTGRYISPNEFRHALVKFDIILSRELVNQIFNLFDTKKGTMDFYAFANWVMNEVKVKAPVHAHSEMSQAEKQHQEALRARLLAAVRQLPGLFINGLRKEFDYDFLTSEMQRNNRPGNISDRDIRYLFQNFGVDGLVTASKLVDFANNRKFSADVVVTKVIESVPPLMVCIDRISNHNPLLLLKCFSSFPLKSPVKLEFNEFRQRLQSEGLGGNLKDVENLYRRLYNKERNTVDLELLFQSVYSVTRKTESRIMSVASESLPTSQSQTSHSQLFVSTCRAERNAREGIRRSYNALKRELKASESLYIDPDVLLEAINTHCTRLSIEDFRLILQPVKTDESGFKINYHHFLELFNPLNATHELENVAHEELYEKGDVIGQENFPVAGAVGEDGSVVTANELNTEELAVGEDAFGALADDNGSVTESIAPFKSTHEDLIVERRLIKTAEDSARRSWMKVLRFCQKEDENRSGLVAREVFLSALSNFMTSLSEPERVKVAESYASEDKKFVNYVNCLKSFYSTASLVTNSTERLVHTSCVRGSRPVHPWEFDYISSGNSLAGGSSIVSVSPLDTSSKISTLPYWKSACNFPRLNPTESILHSNFKWSAFLLVKHGYSPIEKAKLLKRYDIYTIELIRKLYGVIKMEWSKLREEFRKKAEKRYSDAIDHIGVRVPVFLKIMKSIDLEGFPHSDLSRIAAIFRGKGMPEYVQTGEMWAMMKMVSEE